MSVLALLGVVMIAEAAPLTWTSSTQGEGFTAQWGRLLLPQEAVVTRALELSFPWGRGSEPGWFAQWSTRVEPPTGECAITFYLADDFVGPTAGYHFLQVLCEDEVVWERDVAGESSLPKSVRVQLPRQETAKALRLSLRLQNKKAVANFGVRVHIAGLQLECGGRSEEVLPIAPVSVEYREWPPDTELPSLPVVGEWARSASIVQPWGVTQDLAVREADAWAPRFADEFGFGAIIMLPTEAHNAIMGRRREAAGTEPITEEQFQHALSVYRAVGLKVIIYTSVMHCGHSPRWQFGKLAAEHPEWSMRDPAGGPITTYGHDWLCPSTGALDYTLQYTADLARRYQADAVMLDNNEFMNSDAGGPTCYCEDCRRGFRAYVQDRFAGRGLEGRLGLPAGEVRIPQKRDDPLWGLWLCWRKRVWAEALETYRRKLRQINPQIVVLANTQYRYSSWVLAVDGQYSHEDAVLSESRSLSAAGMASKMILGRALAQGRPLWNYIGTFEERNLKRLRGPEEVAAITAASIAAGANPWVVFYGFTGDENQASLATLSGYLQFWRQHAGLISGGADKGDVGVILSPESRDLAGETMPPRWLVSLLQRGFALRGIWEPAGCDETALDGAQAIVATSAVCMRRRTAEQLAEWVREGGRLIVRPDTGWRDEYDRWRAQGALVEALGKAIARPGEHAAGKGTVCCAESDEDVSDAVAGVVAPRLLSERPAGVHWRVTDDGRQVMAIVSYEQGAAEVTVRLPAGAQAIAVMQPGRTTLHPRATHGAEGAMASFELQERLAVLAFGVR